MKILSALLAALVLCGLGGVAAGAPTNFDCPKSLAVTQSVATSAGGWEVVGTPANKLTALENIQVFTDHPSKMGNLIPDQTKRHAKTEVTTWMLAPDPMPYWIACVYSESRAVLARPIPKAAKQCRMTESVVDGKLNGIASFVCE
jgi:hypothetical protein